jgi:hypothetical protein
VGEVSVLFYSVEKYSARQTYTISYSPPTIMALERPLKRRHVATDDSKEMMPAMTQAEFKDDLMKAVADNEIIIEVARLVFHWKCARPGEIPEAGEVKFVGWIAEAVCKLVAATRQHATPFLFGNLQMNIVGQILQDVPILYRRELKQEIERRLNVLYTNDPTLNSEQLIAAVHKSMRALFEFRVQQPAAQATAAEVPST